MSQPHDAIHQAALRAKEREEQLAALDFDARCDFHLTVFKQDAIATHTITCINCKVRELRCTMCVVALAGVPCFTAYCGTCKATACFHSLFTFDLLEPTSGGAL